jgi:hypothetical protein
LSGHASNTWPLIFIIVASVLGFLIIVSYWTLFKKAGKPGWAAVVPIYDYWVLAEVGGKPGWWSLVFFLGLIAKFAIFILPVYLVIYVLITIGVTRNFGKSPSFIFLLIFLPFIGYPILAFGKAKYKPVLSAEKPAK